MPVTELIREPAVEHRPAAHAPAPPRDAPCERAADMRTWQRRSAYYHEQLRRLFSMHVRPGSRVLEIGCGLGDLLADLVPAHGVGVEPDPRLAAAARRLHPDLDIHCAAPESFDVDGAFDYVVVSNGIGAMLDVQAMLERVRSVCTPDTRVLVAYFNALWEPALNAASAIGLRRRTGPLNWLSSYDIRNILDLAHFEVVSWASELLLPSRVPVISTLVNRIAARLWPFTLVNLVTFFVARPRMARPGAHGATCSIIVPTHNERGNIERAVRSIPRLGDHTEILFVDGASDDGTVDAIRQCRAAHPELDIALIEQGGRLGKGDAVRQGFAAAKGDVLMILDADLTVAADDLRKFYNVLVEGKAEFINGTRLVYPMEAESMRFLNKCANRFFSILFTWLIGQRFRDTLCGTKAMWRSGYDRIAAGRSYFGDFDPFGDFDLIFGAAAADLKVAEIPVRYKARTYGETSIHRFRDGLLLLKMSWIAMRKLKFR